MERFFHSELDNIRTDMIRMGSKSVDIVRLAIRTLIENDTSLVGEVIKSDDEIDELNKTIDAEVVRYFTLRAPVAKDVRLLTVAMKCSRELERIADEAVSIAKRARSMTPGSIKDFYNIPRTAELALLLLNDSLDAFTQEDIVKAHGIPQRDKDIDVLHRKTYNKLSDFILEHKKLSSDAIHLMFISKSIERVGDHATNIAEEVVYMLSGNDIRHTEETKHNH